MREDPPLDQKCKDKFLVQSVAIGNNQANGNVSAVVCAKQSRIAEVLEANMLDLVAGNRKDIKGCDPGEEDPRSLLAAGQRRGCIYPCKEPSQWLPR
jgi:hypothetical protein